MPSKNRRMIAVPESLYKRLFAERERMRLARKRGQMTPPDTGVYDDVPLWWVIARCLDERETHRKRNRRSRRRVRMRLRSCSGDAAPPQMRGGGGAGGLGAGGEAPISNSPHSFESAVPYIGGGSVVSGGAA